MKDMKIKIIQEVIITGEDIDDILSIAFEGGINYWCKKIELGEKEKYLGAYASDQISRGGTLKIFDSETDDIYILDLKKMKNGIKLYLKNKGKNIDIIDKRIDMSNIDICVADEIVQYALFNDIIFG